MKKLESTPFLIFFFLVVQACGQNQVPNATVNSVEDMYALAAKSDNIRSFMVSHKGELIAEKYFESFVSDSLEHLRSATKTIMATLIGVAVDKGMIQSIEDPIAKYIPDVPDDKKEMKIRHLLNMTSGFQWNEGAGYNDHNKMIDSGNPLKHMMSLPMAAKPGTKWQYSSGDIHMLSVILSNTAGMSTEAFARKHFFGPMGITDLRWQKFGDGYTAGGSRLELKPRDMLKIGLMFANGGRYENQQIVSQDYLDRSTEVIYQFNANAELSEGYGYGWWTLNNKGEKAAMAMGYGGQMITVIPEDELVVVTTHQWRVNSEMAGAQENRGGKLAQAIWFWAKEQ